ncbi:uncharacterized protein LOC131235095 [Magnolia sinica]|uniref:uncharacterized protein LOC131235095 n=1 Tax=Magnolia sinica TaxID=86752 RepID=UPI0026584465|nr:uncharacterized protein LOC131235095 [Magnolia sinica]
MVFVGRNPRIYDTWEDCKRQVHQVSGCKHKSFRRYEDAMNAWNHHKATVFDGAAGNKPRGDSVHASHHPATMETKTCVPTLGERIVFDNMGSEDVVPERVAAVIIRDELLIDRSLIGLLLGLLILYAAIREFILSLSM